MAKRFVDTELDDKEWFFKLPCRLKCAVNYIFRKCDSSGIWEPNYTLAGMYIGEPIIEAEILAIDDGNQFERLPSGKIFVIGFCDFQYGQLSEDCKPHRPIIQKLKKHNLFERVSKGYRKGFETLEEKDKYKEKETDNTGGVGDEFVRDAEKFISGRQKDFEAICMTTEKIPHQAKESLTRYHLWMEREGKYPVTKRQALSGFKLWLMGDKGANGPPKRELTDYEKAIEQSRQEALQKQRQ